MDEKLIMYFYFTYKNLGQVRHILHNRPRRIINLYMVNGKIIVLITCSGRTESLDLEL